MTGIVEYIQRAAKNSPAPIRVDIVATHGMCVHGATWEAGILKTMEAVLGVPRQSTFREGFARPSNFATGYAGKAGAEQPPRSEGPNLDRVPFFGTTTFSSTSGIVGLRRGQTITVVLHTIVWSPLVMPARKALCYDVSSVTKNVCDGVEERPPPGSTALRRATINAALKNQLLDGCLVDAIYYAGAGKKPLREFMERALLQILRVPGGLAVGEQRATFILTESLGSKIVFDALADLQKRREQEFHEVTSGLNVVTVFMAANQIPILALADEPSDGAIAGMRALASMNAKGGPLRFVAISDPNDLLTWHVRRAPSIPGMGDSLVDVTFTSSKVYFGLAAEPYAAHTKYFDREPIRQLLRNGIHPSERAMAN